MTLTLTSPTGTSVKLWDEAVGDGEDLVRTFPTTLEPAESLDAFDGEEFNGEWQLTVADGVQSQTGTLNSWGITVRDKVTATAEISPITVTGLTNFRDYTCSVSAITGLGIGPASNEEPVNSIAKPTGIRATNGNYSDRVEVTWNLVIGASVYRVFRCESADSSSCGSPLGYPKGTAFSDTEATPGIVYFYRVRACLTNTCGIFSVPRQGSINVGFVQPTNVRASNGDFSDRVRTCKTNVCSKFSFANSGHRGSVPSIESNAQMGAVMKDGDVPIPTMNSAGRLLLILMMTGFGLLLIGRGYLRMRD